MTARTLVAILLLTPYYLVNVLKLSAVASGLVLALSFVGSLIGAPLSARLVARIGQRPTAFAECGAQSFFRP